MQQVITGADRVLLDQYGMFQSINQIITTWYLACSVWR
jgi:hypothetical protein